MAQQKSSRKWGRTKKSGQNARYINEGRHNKSHVRRIAKHLKRYGEADKVAAAALKNYKIKAGIITAKPA